MEGRNDKRDFWERRMDWMEGNWCGDGRNWWFRWNNIEGNGGIEEDWIGKEIEKGRWRWRRERRYGGGKKGGGWIEEDRGRN